MYWDTALTSCPSSEREMNCSLKEHNDLETAFFQSNGAYRQLDCGSVGIGELCDRLRRMLHKHLLGEPPKVQAEINKKHKKHQHDLSLLGEARETPKE